MGCGCGKKKTGTVHFMGQVSSDTPDPTEWGPIVWKYLHCLTEKIGHSGSKITDTDQANYMEILITTLHQVIPCPECQAHTAAYISHNPLPTLKGLYGDQLRSTVRTWLFNFHNNVRSTKGQQLIINSLNECREAYVNCFIPKCEYSLFVQNVAFAVRQGWVRVDNWRKWYSNSERIRIITGNVVN
jgi:hypothetical protein